LASKFFRVLTFGAFMRLHEIKKSFRYSYLGIPLVVFLFLSPGGCFSKKGKLIPFDSLSSYYPYPQDLERFRLYLQVGQPDYVIFLDEGYKEQWVYVCKDIIYNFEPISTEGKHPMRITSQALTGTKVEAKLSEEDREQLVKCKDEKSGSKQGEVEGGS